MNSNGRRAVPRVTLISVGLQCCSAVLWSGKQTPTLHASKHYSCVCSSEELLLCSSICYLLGTLEEAAGPALFDAQSCSLSRVSGVQSPHTRVCRALMCRLVEAFFYLGRQAESAAGGTGGKGTLKQAEVGEPGRLTVRLRAAETNQTEVLTLWCSFTTTALMSSFSSCIFLLYIWTASFLFISLIKKKNRITMVTLWKHHKH